MNAEIQLKNISTSRNYRDNDAKRYCLDCVFWYRCKLGGIDCDLKA